MKVFAFSHLAGTVVVVHHIHSQVVCTFHCHGTAGIMTVIDVRLTDILTKIHVSAWSNWSWREIPGRILGRKRFTVLVRNNKDLGRIYMDYE
jgi:hypothetical protein